MSNVNTHLCATFGNWENVNPTKEMALEEDIGKNSVLITAARNCRLHKVPKILLYPEAILKENHRGETCIHHAATNGELSVIPKTLLTEKNILKKSCDGFNAIHFACLGGFLNLIPKKFLTSKNLMLKTAKGTLPIELANNARGDINDPKNRKKTINLILSILNDKDIDKLNQKVFPAFAINIKESIAKEIQKRKIVKKLSSKEQSLEI